MQHLYIDESGSMLAGGTGQAAAFIISIVRVKDPTRLRHIHKHFVGKHMDELRKSDMQGKMFNKDGKFIELKGSAMTPDLKRKFLSFFCQNHLFDVFYIEVENAHVSKGLYRSTARAFNYLLRKAFQHWLRTGEFLPEEYDLQVDERNVKTNSRATLQEYLNTEFQLEDNIDASFSVSYFDSSSNKLIQIADVFSNVFYSERMTGAYSEDLKALERSGYLHKKFVFPLSAGKYRT